MKPTMRRMNERHKTPNNTPPAHPPTHPQYTHKKRLPQPPPPNIKKKAHTHTHLVHQRESPRQLRHRGRPVFLQGHLQRSARTLVEKVELRLLLVELHACMHACITIIINHNHHHHHSFYHFDFGASGGRGGGTLCQTSHKGGGGALCLSSPSFLPSDRDSSQPTMDH